MGSFRRPRIFDALDLEIIDLVYEAAWARVEANNLTRDISKDGERRRALRQWIFALVDSHPVDFDALRAACCLLPPRLPQPHAGATS